MHRVSTIRMASVLSLVWTACVSTAIASGTGGSMHATTMPSQSVPQFDVAAEFRKGVDALKASQYADAEQSFGRVLDASPRDPNVHFYMGLAQGGQGKLADARGHFEKAVRYDDKLVFARMELGVTLAKLGEADKAHAQLDELRKREGACGDACAQASDLHKAVATLQAELAPPAVPAPGAPATPAAPASPASTPDPSQPSGHAPSARVPAAQELLDASIASGDGAYLHAVELINQKRYEEAIASLEASERAFGPHPDILTYLGFANRKLGRLDIAEAYYRRALAEAPDHLGATEYYGELLVVRGDLDGARRLLARLENACHFGCAQADELRRWVDTGKPPSS